MTKRTIAITGASGRLGSVLFAYFDKSPEYKVFRVSRLAREGFLSYDEFISDPVLSQVDVLLHLAWSSVPRISEANFGGEWQEDIPLLVRMLQAIKYGNHEHIHFVFFSSAGAIYGDTQGVMATEDMSCQPANMYGWGKLHAEQIIEQFTQRCLLPVTVLRLSNIYGISSRENDQQGVIPYIVKATSLGEIMSIWGDGTAQKDYLHAHDLLDAIEIIVRDKIRGLFNLSFGTSHSLYDIIGIVENITGKMLEVNHAEAFPWDNASVFVDNQKCKDCLGWSPSIDLEAGIDGLVKLSKIEI